MTFSIKPSLLLLTLSALLMQTACKEDPQPEPGSNGIRSRIDYSTLTATTPYRSLFTDSKGDTVADLSAGNTRFKMFQALNYYLGSAVRDSRPLDSLQLINLYTNNGNPFSDISTLNISGTALNSSGLNLRGITATADATQTSAAVNRLYKLFGEMARLSVYFADTAAPGKPGLAGNYLADAQGIEVAQVIQKSLIGAMQLDYIGNRLLEDGLNADNKTLLTGKNYTQLEQNWDEAYGFLTLNSVYLQGSTDAVRGTPESFMGAYIWEYNKSDYPAVYPAFLRGRAAIANNDVQEARNMANTIRRAMEKAMANAAVGYLNKWKTGTTDAARIHAIAEGLGFIYSLRYCKLNGASAQFSDNVLNNLLNTPGGYWDLTAAKINTAAASISTQFNL